MHTFAEQSSKNQGSEFKEFSGLNMRKFNPAQVKISGFHSGNTLQRKCPCSGTHSHNCECEGCRKKRLNLQRKSANSLQPKLTVNSPGDMYEKEADEVADRVMRMKMPLKGKPFFSPKTVSNSGFEQTYIRCEKGQKKIPNAPIIQKQHSGIEAHPSDFTLTAPTMLQPSSGPDFLALRRPFIDLNILHLWDENSALLAWNYNYNFFIRLGIPLGLSTTLSNWTTPRLIDTQLRAANPTWWDLTDRELNTSTISASIPLLEFNPDFSPVAPSWLRNIFLPRGGGTVHRKYAECKEEEKPIQRKEGNEEISTDSLSLVSDVINSSGKPLDEETRAYMDPRFGYDFSKVRIHDGKKAAQSAQAVNALAYTVGNNIVFNQNDFSPQSDGGKKLLAHELSHTLQQGGNIYRRIQPEDVSGQLVGQFMVVESNFTNGTITVSAGSSVEIVAWSNIADTATVQLRAPYLNAFIPFDIPKILLRPTSSSSGLYRYSSGIDQTVRDINRGNTRIASELSRRGGARPGEVARLQGLQRIRQALLNKRLIQETMYNRFDSNIIYWTNFYNRQFNASHFGNLDPNLVKALLFQESEIGTSGQFMNVVPPNREMGIHNLGQVIDSSASALLIMMQEMEPALITTYHLQNISRDTNNRPTGISAEDFMWSYVARGQTQGFQDAVIDFYARPGGSMRDTDYDFWIQTCIRWLFEKRGSVRSWSEAIRAYNGSGAGARHYRDIIIRRTMEAANATSYGRPYIPHR